MLWANIGLTPLPFLTIISKTYLDLELLYQDEHLVAINKPPGLLVHRTRRANDATDICFAIAT